MERCSRHINCDSRAQASICAGSLDQVVIDARPAKPEETGRERQDAVIPWFKERGAVFDDKPKPLKTASDHGNAVENYPIAIKSNCS